MGQHAACLADLLRNTLDLIYAGNAELARAYVKAAFEGTEDQRLGFVVELGLQLNGSPYLGGILEVNEVATIGQLLAGDETRFGAWD